MGIGTITVLVNKMWILKKFNNWWWQKHPPEQVKYYKTKETEKGRLIMTDDGLKMDIRGEKYALPHFPRGHLLANPYYHTPMSVMKHRIKNEIFNWAWAELDKGTPKDQIIDEVKNRLFNDIYGIMYEQRYDIASYEKMCPMVREVWRAMTKLEKENDNIRKLKEMLCHIMQEDDGYRFRVQFLTEYFNPGSWWFKLLRRSKVKYLKIALDNLVHAEVVGDMRGRIKLLTRIVMLVLEDERTLYWFNRLCDEIDWSKIKLSKADRYYARGKWFRPDQRVYDY
jgi:hypothetical protein